MRIFYNIRWTRINIGHLVIDIIKLVLIETRMILYIKKKKEKEIKIKT